MRLRAESFGILPWQTQSARVLACALVTLLCLPAVSYAQDDKSTPSSPGILNLKTETPISVGTDLTALGNLEMNPETLGSQIFELDMTKVGCLTGETTCIQSDEMLDMRYSKSLTTSLMDKGIDIELTPRASVRYNDGTSSALVGALVRIGDDLKDGEEFRSNTWYVFAGADAEAVTYSQNDMDRANIRDFNLQERVIVGDAQAGVGYRLSESTDISLGYFRREVTTFGNESDLQTNSYSEDAAALSFTWRR